MAAGLRRLGIGPGDVVAIYLPNIPEAAVALLAIPRIGAIVLPLFSGFGADAVVTRLNDAKAKAVITVDGSLRRGRVVAAKQVIDEARTRVPSLQHVIVCHRIDAPMQWTAGLGSPLARCHCRRRRRPLRTVGGGRHALPAGLHLRHHGQAQGRGPHPLRVSGEDGPRSRHLHGLQAGRPHPVDVGHGLARRADPGLRHDADGRHHGACGGYARLPEVGPHLADRVGAPRQLPGHCPDHGARLHGRSGFRRWPLRSRLAQALRLDRGSLDAGSLALAVRNHRRQASADPEFQRRHGDGRHTQLGRDAPDQAVLVHAPGARARPLPSSTRRVARRRPARSASSSCAGRRSD